MSSFCNCARGLYSVLTYVCCRRETAAVLLQCCPKEGECPYPFAPATKNVPRFISSLGWGWEEGVIERPLFWSFVYVSSGIRVLGQQRSLGMLGLYSLGIICSSLYVNVLYIVGLNRPWDIS